MCISSLLVELKLIPNGPLKMVGPLLFLFLNPKDFQDDPHYC
jgi:hypothetical protein